VVRRGVKVAFAVGEVRDADGRLVATAQGSWHLWQRRPGRRATAGSGSVVLGQSGRSLRVGKIVAVGRNYADHIAEMGAPRGAPPVVFLKPSTALGGAGGRLAIPSGEGEVHHEVELVAVIGRSGRAIDPARGLEHVLGYAVGLDLTLRDLQGRAKRRGEPWALAKGFDGSAPVSAVRARERVGDGSGLEIALEVNGERRQHGNTSQMLHGVAELVAHVSRWMTLERGDLLFTGTPAGVGPLCPGDRVEARIERVGELRLEVVALEPA
jgi:2-keto-4-pentenoate hydratase/2-oxohepta-3-ene-1,7-dioic acid hydratase in catechol pathway